MEDFNGCKDLNQQRRLYDIFSHLERTALNDLSAVIHKCSTLLMQADTTIIDTDTLEELEFKAGHYEPYNDPVNHFTRRNLT